MTQLREIPRLHIADIELPRSVERLYDLAYNLWWTWHPETVQLFAGIEPVAWAMYRNPVQLLINVEPSHWELLTSSEEFTALYEQIIDAFDRYMDAADTWFQQRYPDYSGGPVAYFSMEYGLHKSLALYSGGLGVLSGDHCKSASDLGIPFVAVGLLYRRGYFRQTIDADGLQQHYYPEYDFARLPVRPAASRTGREIRVAVPFPDREVLARVWVAQVGRVPLLLLDTDISQNHAADRPITNVLYTQGREMRLAQELVLGVGGALALDALGIEPAVWHINEGHSALVQLERARRELAAGGDWAQALERVRAATIFTAHTPVPAGNERFDAQLVRGHLGPWIRPGGPSADMLLALGEDGAKDHGRQFNLTALAIRTSRFVNGVSRLNAEVLNTMWRGLFPAEPPRPIRSISNGVHTLTWIGRELRTLFERCLAPNWRRRLMDPDAWSRVHDIPDGDLWSTHQAQKARLARFTRSRQRDQFARHGGSPSELRAVDHLFDPEVLTIGFARRFAIYKRADLLFHDMERLPGLFGNSHQRLQVLFAGKAHPADRDGQELIQSIFRLSQSEALRGRVFFIEDYDMRVGRMLVQGVDVWLNTPRRPMEASGTSGMKAALNGALNVSIPDGWWPEAYDGENGWVIGDGERRADDAEQDRSDAEALYALLEKEILPLYYERDEDGLPLGWIARMKHAIATIGPAFSCDRMLRDYVEQAYLVEVEEDLPIAAGPATTS